MSGVKHDQGKPPMSLLPTVALVEVAKVLDFGKKKYTADNWRGGMDWRRLIDAGMRHLAAFSDGEDLDPETGLPHLAHAACCIMFLIEYQQKGIGWDDRYKPRPKQFQNPPLAKDTVIHEPKPEPFRTHPRLENDPGVDLWIQYGNGTVFGR